MRRLFLGVSLILIGLIYNVIAYASTLMLENIVGESSDKATLISLAFNSSIDGSSKVEVEEHGSFLQVVISGVSVVNPGTFYEANSPFVRKVAAFQIDENKAGVRLFVTKDANLVKPAVSFDRLGKQLAVHIDHDLIQQSYTPAPVPGVPSAEEVIASTQIRNDIPDPANITHAVNDSSPSENSSKLGILTNLLSSSGNDYAKLDAVAIFSVVILAAYLIGWVLKRHQLRKKMSSTDLQALQMKTLSTYALAPKQSLKLIEIGHKKVLLSVSPEGVNYLTSIEDPHGNYSEQMHPSILNSSQQRPIQAKSTPPLQMPRPSSQRELLTDQPKLTSDRVTRAGLSNSKSTAAKILEDTDDQGVQVRLKSSRAAKSRTSRQVLVDDDLPAQSASIEDVTNLIRRKLKDLPKI